MENTKKIIKRLDNVVDDIKNRVNRVENPYNEEDIIRDLSNFTDYILQQSMEDRAVSELDVSIGYIIEAIEDDDFEDIDSVVYGVFEDARINGTLTFSTYMAEKEVYANYSFEEIREKMQEYNFENIEQIHISLVEDIFRDKLEEEYELNDFDNFDHKERIIYSLYTLLDKNGYSLDEEHSKKFKELEEKTEKSKWDLQKEDDEFER